MDTGRINMYNVMVRGFPLTWGISAVGSAPHWQCGGHGFESRMLHQAGNAPQRDRRAVALRFLFSPTRRCQEHKHTTDNPHGGQRRMQSNNFAVSFFPDTKMSGHTTDSPHGGQRRLQSSSSAVSFFPDTKMSGT